MVDTIQIGDKSYTPEEIEVLSKAGVLNIGQKNDPASATLTAQALHGPFQGNSAQLGLFGGVGVRPDRFSAMPQVADGLVAAIASMGGLSRSQFTNERLDILTGQTGGGTTNATGFCGNPPSVGNLKVMRRDFTWGNYYVKTDLNALALLGQFNTRADVPGQIINGGSANNPLIPDIMFSPGLNDQSQLRIELYKIGVDLSRTMEVVAQRGSAGVDNSRTGWFAEFAGLESQITTGFTDAPTGLAASVVDSVVVAYNAGITGTAADGSGRRFFNVLRDTWRALKLRAQRAGMGGTVFAIVARPELIERIVEVAATQSAIYSGVGAQYAEINRDGEAIENRRVQMLSGQYVLLDGVQVPLISSEGQSLEGIANNTYRNDVFIVPMNWMGTPLTRIEWFPMDNTSTSEFASAFGNTGVGTLNNGMFLTGNRNTGLCIEYHFQARFRLILETPFLAARVDNVEYSYVLNTTEAIPGGSLYRDGGVSYRT
jgi:hypothetical protein